MGEPVSYTHLIGASGGIGYHVAKRLLKHYSVIGTFFKNKDSLLDLEKETNFTAVSLNVSSTDNLKEFSQNLSQQNTELYAIINCSGIVLFEDDRPEFDVWDKTIDINLTANYKIHKILSKHIMNSGSFIMTSSTDARFGTPSAISYAVSKAGVDSLTKSLALTYQDRKRCV